MYVANRKSTLRVVEGTRSITEVARAKVGIVMTSESPTTIYDIVVVSMTHPPPDSVESPRKPIRVSVDQSLNEYRLKSAVKKRMCLLMRSHSV